MGSALGSEPHVGGSAGRAQYVVKELRLEGVIETCLYVDDLDRAARFYEQVLGLNALTSDARFRAYDVGGQSVLLLFHRGSTLETVRMPGGTIPPHDGHGPLHMAFAVAADALPQWEQRLAEQGGVIEGRTTWSRGGRRLHFRPPHAPRLEVRT